MLNLKPYKAVQEDFEKLVTNRIQNAQKDGIPSVSFDYLPPGIINDLHELGYPCKWCNLSNKYDVTVL